MKHVEIYGLCVSMIFETQLRPGNSCTRRIYRRGRQTRRRARAHLRIQDRSSMNSTERRVKTWMASVKQEEVDEVVKGLYSISETRSVLLIHVLQRLQAERPPC